MRRGPPPTGGAKPPLSSSNVIHPLPVIEEDAASHDDDETPKVPEKSPRRVSPLEATAGAAATRTRGSASAPRVTTPTPPSPTPTPTPPPPPPPTRRILLLRRAAAAAAPSGSGGGRLTAAEQEASEKVERSLKSCLAERGGWYRIALMAVLAVCAIVALTVGLTIGLRQKKRGAAAPVLFPAGSYAFTTALYNTTGDCTTNNRTFRCYPFRTYRQCGSDSDSDSDADADADAAAATYFWTIAPVNSWAFRISAAPNPFVPQFANLSLTQLDANQFSERLTFNSSMHGAAVVPTAALGDNNDDDDRAATCYYHDTLVTGTIWTRRPAEFPANLTTLVSNGGGHGEGNGKPMTSSTTFEPWPYAVRVVQSTRDAPDCRDADGNRVGGDFGPPPDRAGECSCSYANFDLESEDVLSASRDIRI
ncbi:uncharacterized protein PG986_003520 [Apiospora aurea]|uniref:Uncharacterized protein n=1 Tax=Apiospora aurea TaxID=335848 RepID=A0ABR1QS37_9PEZI